MTEVFSMSFMTSFSCFSLRGVSQLTSNTILGTNLSVPLWIKESSSCAEDHSSGNRLILGKVD